MPHISCILVTSPRSRRTSRSVQLVREVVDAEVEAKVDAVADVNVPLFTRRLDPLLLSTRIIQQVKHSKEH